MIIGSPQFFKWCYPWVWRWPNWNFSFLAIIKMAATWQLIYFSDLLFFSEFPSNLSYIGFRVCECIGIVNFNVRPKMYFCLALVVSLLWAEIFQDLSDLEFSSIRPTNDTFELARSDFWKTKNIVWNWWNQINHYFLWGLPVSLELLLTGHTNFKTLGLRLSKNQASYGVVLIKGA